MLPNFEERLERVTQAKAEAEQRVADLEKEKEQQVNQPEKKLSSAKEPCDWVISRFEINVKEKSLGSGGYGEVFLGTFRGCEVAVKRMHNLILSRHNRSSFEREMKIASRCRHPCLLQFIGATNDDGKPLFVTELMESSLRQLLEKQPLLEKEITVISLDVARALSYLHQYKPSPILHRDISSANVLLWRQGDQWRGKVSDYGTAKFMQPIMTAAPGNILYSAPEAKTSIYSVKVSQLHCIIVFFFLN